MERTIYREISFTGQLWMWAAVMGAFILGALASVVYVEHHGHIVTGMNNQIVWGTPHVFAIFLIVAASGALNVASMASVFDRTVYKPLSRLSGVLAIALLMGGLAVLVLDLGRPDRLLVAMTHFNFSSIFTWNIFLYTGFMGIVALYLFVQMSRDVHPKWVKPAGILAFVWRLALTTGTGSIFGWLVARPGYDAAIMAPLFIAMSFALGLAVFILVLIALCRLGERKLGPMLIHQMTRLLALFVGAVLYFTAVHHLSNIYVAQHSGVERFFLLAGGTYTFLFWIVQVAIGSILPIVLIYRAETPVPTKTAILASALVILGGFAQLYVIVIGGQAYPMDIFPGYEVTSSFFDGARASYAPSLPEVALGQGGIALALLVTFLGAKILRILPTNLADSNRP
ncbi:NrfD/PsrC family molybdoenzyme membrane anchor subunit [Aliiruegeria lutimaris]|uniref:Prokaryotic molybdopterin-containing oxidoreductase family, membrane subunit n=1 Tax=Aliiruegeria lutimaris TaxID=571298 RepID=A0A1G8S9H7_9RHOB|nr:NrfD/PsrC family molybdoenzyme membrane anchor subunit [Aliiruegeria lutimaris]SDJ25854.1 prokaryotic molybdopterin-containing oxidoreductase family, membrane subunit [Aliiruegeria lutimaris]